MNCEVSLPWNEMKGKISEYYFYQTMSMYVFGIVWKPSDATKKVKKREKKETKMESKRERKKWRKRERKKIKKQ